MVINENSLVLLHKTRDYLLVFVGTIMIRHVIFNSKLKQFGNYKNLPAINNISNHIEIFTAE